MSAQLRKCRKSIMRLACIAVGVLLATTIEARAKIYNLECIIMPDGVIIVRNMTGINIPRGLEVTVLQCAPSPSVPSLPSMPTPTPQQICSPEPYKRRLYLSLMPGDTSWREPGWEGPASAGVTACKATVDIPPHLAAARTPTFAPSKPSGIPVSVPCDIWPGNDGQVMSAKNTTGKQFPRGTKLVITECTANGCRTYERETNIDSYPNDFIDAWGRGVTGVISCTATVYLPPDFARKKTDPKAGEATPKFTRVKPPGPPQPGLLEDSPGYSRQAPSSVGTPKPSAPPPSPRGAPTLR